MSNFSKTRMFTAKLLLAGLIGCSTSAAFALEDFYLASAPAVDLPNHCEFGRTSSQGDVVVQLQDVQNFYHLADQNDETGSWSDAADDLQAWYSSYDYLRIEGPNHVLFGQSARFKGNLFEAFSNVRFHTAEDGYVGTDKSNYEANAYHYLTFDKVYGPSFAWITNSGLCSAKGVWVQYKPTLSGSYANNSVTISYKVDKYSRAVLNGKPSTITVYARTERGGSSETVVGTKQVTGKQGSVSIVPSGFRSDQGTVYFSAHIHDGTYTSDRINIKGTYTKTCPTGRTGQFQISPNSTDYSRVCGTDKYGNNCPVSAYPISYNPYPLLKYTCQ